MDRCVIGFVVLMASGAGGCAVCGPYSPLAPLERSLVFRPSLEVDAAPAGAVDVEIQTDDGIRLHGRYFGSPADRVQVLYCHGNAGSVAGWTSEAAWLSTRHRCGVLVFDYRGYGASEGSPSEEGVLRDARAARRWLARHADIPERDVVLMGRSLGGAVAVDLAAADGARALVLQSTFPSLPEVVAWHLPWLAPQWMMATRFDSASKLRHYMGPLLMCHGDADRLIPLALGRQLYDAAAGAKRFIMVTGGHNDPPGPEFDEAMEEFLKQLP